MADLMNVSDLLQNGQQYTFTFDFSILGLGPTGAADKITQVLVDDPDLGSVYVTHPGLNPIGQETWVTFIYLGPSNTNHVSDVALNIKQIVEGNFIGAIVTFTRAQQGASGGSPASPGPGATCKNPLLNSCLDSFLTDAKWLGIFAVIILALVLAIKVS